MTRAERVAALAGADGDPVYEVIMDVIGSFREECVLAATASLTESDKLTMAAVGGIEVMDNLKREIDGVVAEAKRTLES